MQNHTLLSMVRLERENWLASRQKEQQKQNSKSKNLRKTLNTKQQFTQLETTT